MGQTPQVYFFYWKVWSQSRPAISALIFIIVKSQNQVKGREHQGVTQPEWLSLWMCTELWDSWDSLIGSLRGHLLTLLLCGGDEKHKKLWGGGRVKAGLNAVKQNDRDVLTLTLSNNHLLPGIDEPKILMFWCFESVATVYTAVGTRYIWSCQ